MNQSRCCANDNGNASSRLTGNNGGAPSPTPLLNSLSTTSASAATVGDSNNTRNATSTFNATRTRDITCVANSECPPNSKKLSFIPTRSTPSTSLQIPHNTSSTAVRGAS